MTPRFEVKSASLVRIGERHQLVMQLESHDVWVDLAMVNYDDMFYKFIVTSEGNTIAFDDAVDYDYRGLCADLPPEQAQQLKVLVDTLGGVHVLDDD